MFSFVLVGHVDAGKSTLAGHLLVHLKQMNEKDWRDITSSDEKQNQMYSHLLDVSNEERIRGKTSDYTCVPIEIEGRKMNMIDTPGHRQFIRCMIEGSSIERIDLAVCIVSTKLGEYESGIRGQTIEHLTILRGIGVKNLIICLNKVDLVSRERVEEVRKNISPYLKKLGFRSPVFIEISAWEGFGFDCLLDTLLSFEEKKEEEKELILEERYEITFKGLFSPCEGIYPSTIKTIGYRCILHSSGVKKNCECELVEILDRGKSKGNWIKEGMATVRLAFDIPTMVGRNIILRSGDETIAIGLKI